MLYLAEVKQTKGFMGIKTELKLIASQDKDQSWTIMPKDTTIVSEEANTFNDGALVVVNLNQNQQIQGSIESGAGRIVNILQNFSRLLSASKKQEQEIEQWQQSLQIQMEALSQREMEMQASLTHDLQERFAELRSVETVEELLNNFNQYLENFEAQKQDYEELQKTVNNSSKDLNAQKEQMQQARASVEEAKIQFRVLQHLLNTKQESLELLNLELRTKEELRERISRLAKGSDDEEQQKVDVNALENMPLGELQETVNKLQKELEKIVRFVNEQEEELTMQSQAIQEIEDKIESASEYDRINLEQELADEQEIKEALDQTLIGQRRTLRERQEFLRQHMRILQRRQGIVSNDWEERVINLKPILQQLSNEYKNLEQKKRKVTNQVEQISGSLSQAQNALKQQEGQLEQLAKDLQEKEVSFQQVQISLAEMRVKVKVYEELLQPLGGSLDEIKQKLRIIEDLLNPTSEQQEAYA
ncbi:MAG: pilus motility taxis protein HmpF [Prochloraceae cyanobacterium]|nr:pilus motility taxis protein HmpF [Prochloraceae cyanobacterium]